MPAVTLLRPEWLLAWVPLAAAVFWLSRRRGGLGGWDQVARPELLRVMAGLGHVQETFARAPFRLFAGAMAVMVFALSGPAVERRDRPTFRNLDAVILVVDVSPSAVQAASWQAMQHSAQFALSALESRPSALVVFAGDAYVAADLSHDPLAISQTVGLLDGETVPDPGSRPERGLALALEILQRGQILTGDVILLSDGGGLGPAAVARAQEIAATGARLSMVGPGAPSEAALQLVEAGQGRGFAAQTPSDLVRFLQRDARRVLEEQEIPLLYWRDLGRYVLGLAALPFLLMFRRIS